MFTHVLLCLCLDLRFHRFVCLDLCSACCHLPCAIVALLSLYLSFLYFGLLVWTQSRPGGLCHRPCPWPTSKSSDHPYLHVYACLFLCVTLVLASLVLGFAMLDAFSGFMVVWLHPMPMRPCLDVTIWDASPWCRLLCAYLSPFQLRAMICLPCLLVRPVGFLCIFTRLLTCPCMSLAC